MKGNQFNQPNSSAGNQEDDDLFGYMNEIITHLKVTIQECPDPSSKEEFEHFTDFFFAFRDFHQTLKTETPNIKLKDKSWYHLEKLWGFVLKKFMLPDWYTDERGWSQALHDKYLQGLIDTQKVKVLITKAFLNGELKEFFKAYPYVKRLIVIDEYLNTREPEEAVYKYVCDIMNSYLQVLDCYEQIQPLLVMREHIKLMLGRPEFDKSFYEKYMKGAVPHIKTRIHQPEWNLAILSLFIGTSISYNLRMLPGFKKLDWDAFDGLHRSIFNKREIITSVRSQEVAEGLEAYLDDLILFQLKVHEEKDIRIPVINDIAKVNVEANIAPALQIIENYLKILANIKQDNTISRLATLRAITAIGEAIHSISLILPEAHISQLGAITDLRDHIIHSSTLDAFDFVNKLVDDPDNRALVLCLNELKNLSGFYTNLKDWLGGNREPTTFPQIPPIDALTLLKNDFTVARNKDDRDEQIPIAQRKALLSSLPTEDNITNPNIKLIEDFIFNGARLDRDSFKDACFVLDSGIARKMHEQIVEWKKVIGLRRALDEGTLDFDKISLNVKKSDKARWVEIKKQKDPKALALFLDDHEIYIGQNSDSLKSFVNSISMINIEHYKDLLRNFARSGIENITQIEFDKAINVVFRDNPNNQKLWTMSYEMLTKKHINSLKRYQIIQLDRAVQNIERLRKELTGIFDGYYVKVDANPVKSIACEMLYGFCLEEFKRIKKLLNSMYDYRDHTLYFFNPYHPLKDVDNLLNSLIQGRNEMFHFEQTFRGTNVEFARMSWFSGIQQLVFGTFFPDATTISRDGVTKGPLMSSPSAQKLQKLRDLLVNDLNRDENSLNMYEAEVKEIICKARITSDTHRVMNVIMPLSQALRANGRMQTAHDALPIVTSLLSNLNIQYIQPETALALLNHAVQEKVVKAEEVKKLVYGTEQKSFASRIMDEVEKKRNTRDL